MDKFKEKLEKIENKKSNKTKNIIDDNNDDNNKNNIINKMLIVDSFNYFDKNQDKYNNKFDKVNYISIDSNIKDLDHDVMHFYDSNFKELFKSKFERIGIFDKVSGIWIWGWSVSHFKKNETNIIRKILHYGTELNQDSIFLKTELTTSRFKISNRVQLDLHCAIASYLSKKPIVFKYNLFNLYKFIDDKYLDILNPDYTIINEQNFELVYYIFILDDI